ncbi:hypothetical protein HD553DRAFT_351522 [Filobasidium floriforme]|uniref:uncharacterized protein n=1 Tax=Filobasidium floriforme TaxID=5210 RepID=UPI001E8CB62F|nr:uncharacterized protein HD553DRAFT_351522 [Filobasidium floriforme]KAH8081404.1 hypothetical protein HD553DRAFT_351522 [Filobasidium floriforme]
MQDLKRKSDKAELDNHHNGNDPMVGLDGAGRKAWLLNEMRLMQDHYKKACVRRAKIMQYHADILERNLHQVRPRAPTYMILGYQSACREWDRSRRNVAAYANRAAEVYVEPTREASPPTVVTNPVEMKPESQGPGTSGPIAVDKDKEVASTSASQPAAKQSSNSNPEPSALITSASKPTPNPGVGSESANPTGLLPSIEILPSQNNSTFAQNNGMNAPPNSYSNGQNMVANQATQSQSQAASSQMGFGMGMDLDSSEVPALDASEMALFDFINSVANSPTAYDSAPAIATGTINGGEAGPGQNGPGGQSGLGLGIGLGLGLGDVGSMGMREQAGSGAGGGLDFGLLEAGLQEEIARTSGPAGQDQDQNGGQVGGNQDQGAAAPNVGAAPSTDAPPSSGQPTQPQPNNDQTQVQAQPQAQNDVQPIGGDALSLEAGTGLAELDLFSQYPDLFPMYGGNDLDDNNNNSNTYNNHGSGNNADGNNDNNANGQNGEGEGDTGIEGFDPTQFDYSSLGEDFFMNGMQGMEGM